MIELRPSPVASVSPGYPALLQPGYYVKYSDAWPATLTQVTYQDKNGITRGKLVQILVTNQVPYDLSYKIPANDFRDVDFSNTLSQFNENLYPMNMKTLYETQIGFKDGDYLNIFYIPAGEYVSRLEQPSMVPNVASPTLRYLGAKKPTDSPYDDKRIYFYSVYQMEPFIMRVFVDNGVDFEKCTIGLNINKCYTQEIPPGSTNYDEALRKSKIIRYYSEERWL
ncbi:MAG: hypothetical protein PHI12_06940 [Dehalococcoidales bacterium]|nr:hypothetical protein [Dehalococcoidales bacterium]